MPSFLFCFVNARTLTKNMPSDCSRCGSANTALLRRKMSPSHLYLLPSSASPAFSPPSHMYIQLALSLHPRGELQRPLLSLCFSRSLPFSLALSSFEVLLCSWHSFTPLLFSGFLPSSLWPPQRLRDWTVLTDTFVMNILIMTCKQSFPHLITYLFKMQVQQKQHAKALAVLS